MVTVSLLVWSWCLSPPCVWSRGKCVHVQASANGVRQGDPLASMLFALSMQSIYQQALVAAGGQHPVTGVAILDDFTIVGKPEDTIKVMNAFFNGCKAAGLNVNRSKCLVLCPQNVDAPSRTKMNEWALQSNIPVSPERFAPLLGSVVGRDEDGMRDWALEYVKRHSRFFEIVVKLKKQIALHVLRMCGVPRFNYVARTLPPRISGAACVAFDEQVMRSFQTVAALHLPKWKTTK